MWIFYQKTDACASLILGRLDSSGNAHRSQNQRGEGGGLNTTETPPFIFYVHNNLNDMAKMVGYERKLQQKRCSKPRACVLQRRSPLLSQFRAVSSSFARSTRASVLHPPENRGPFIFRIILRPYFRGVDKFEGGMLGCSCSQRQKGGSNAGECVLSHDGYFAVFDDDRRHCRRWVRGRFRLQGGLIFSMVAIPNPCPRFYKNLGPFTFYTHMLESSRCVFEK